MANREARLEAAVDAALEAGLAGRKVVGAALRITLDGNEVYSRAAGFADREAGIKLREDAIFRMASMSKAIVATTALALIERGKLGLDDPASRYLPAFRPRLKDGTTPELLVRHLMTHTSGLTYGFVQKPGHRYHRAGVSDGMDQPGLSMEENLRRIASVPLEFAPGTAWGYSVSIDVLGAVIAAANGTTLGEAVRQYVTAPLGMTDTAFTVSGRTRLVVPYADGPGEPIRMGDPQAVSRPEDPDTHLIFSPARVFDERSFESGGAGLNGTTADYARFMEALRNGGGAILKPETVAMAARNQIGTLPREAKDAGLRNSFFTGMVEDPVAAKTPQSTGTMTFGGAWGNTGFMDRTRGLSVVTLTNTAVEGVAGTFPTMIRDAIYGVLNGA
jgi:CubicO group peptidase (beta-lactamase class C family)